MTRYEIYRRYLEVGREKLVNYITCENIGNVKYEMYETTDIGVKFYKAKIDLQSVDGYKNYSIDIEGNLEIKINILSEINGIPVVSLNRMIDLSFIDGDSEAILDLSGSDLSNIIDIGSIHSNQLLKYAGIRLPKNRELRPVNVVGLFACMDGSDIERELEHIDLSEVAILDDMFMLSGIKSFDFNRVKSKNVTSMPNMFYSCLRLENITGTLKSKGRVEVEDLFYGCESLVSIEKGLFDNVHLEKVGDMFNSCYKLRDIPRLAKHIGDGIGNNSALDLFKIEFNLGMSEINNIIRAMIGNEYTTYGMFRRSYGSVDIGYINTSFQAIKGMFIKSKLDLINISGLYITNLNEAEKSSDADVIAMLLFGNDINYSDLSSIEPNDIKRIPKTIIVNKDMPATRLVPNIYKLLDFKGMTRTQIKSKFNLMTAMGDIEDRYIVVTDYRKSSKQKLLRENGITI